MDAGGVEINELRVGTEVKVIAPLLCLCLRLLSDFLEQSEGVGEVGVPGMRGGRWACEDSLGAGLQVRQAESICTVCTAASTT